MICGLATLAILSRQDKSPALFYTKRSVNSHAYNLISLKIVIDATGNLLQLARHELNSGIRFNDSTGTVILALTVADWLMFFKHFLPKRWQILTKGSASKYFRSDVHPLDNSNI